MKWGDTEMGVTDGDENNNSAENRKQAGVLIERESEIP